MKTVSKILLTLCLGVAVWVILQRQTGQEPDAGGVVVVPAAEGPAVRIVGQAADGAVRIPDPGSEGVGAHEPASGGHEQHLRLDDSQPAKVQSTGLLAASEEEVRSPSRFAGLIDDAKLLMHDRIELGGGRVLERGMYKTDMRYPMILVKRTLRIGSNGEELLDEKALIADHILVQSDLSAEELAAVNERYRGVIRHRIPNQPVYLISFEDVTLDTVDEALEAYGSTLPRDAVVEPDFIVYTSAIPDDPSYGSLWGLSGTYGVGGPAAWDYSTGGDTVLVGVIDTGVDYTHDDLIANRWTNPGEIFGNGVDDDNNGYVDDFYGYDFVNGDSDPMDDHSHGTHCAGTIGAVGDNSLGVVGVSWNVRIGAGKFLAANGFGPTSAATEALYYFTALGFKITNNSWGGGGYSTTLKNAVDYAGTQDALFIAAAGNSSTNNDSSPHYPSSYTSANLISVTSLRSSGSQIYNYGATSVDIGAPGYSILSTIPGDAYGWKSGTSMATPHVAGAAALLKSLLPNYSHSQLKSLIMDSSVPTPSLTGKCVSGGRLDVSSAFDDAGLPKYPLDLTAELIASDTVQLDWTDNASNETGFQIQTRKFIGNLENEMTDAMHGVLDPSETDGPVVVPDSSSGYVRFDGVNDGLRVYDHDALSIGNGSSDRAYSLSVWIRAQEMTKFRALCKGDNQFLEYALTFDSADKLRMIIWDADQTSRQDLISDQVFTGNTDQWLHLAMTYTGSGGATGMKLYANGALLSTTTSSSGSYARMSNTSSDLMIGAMPLGAGTFSDGDITGVRVYERELSASDISSIHNGGRYASSDVINETGLAMFHSYGAVVTGWSELSTTAENVQQFQHANVSEGSHYYRVLAVSTAGVSRASNTDGVSGAGSASTLGAPNTLSAVAISSSQVDLNWTDASTNETSFIVERRTAGDEGTVVVDSSGSGNDGSLEPSVSGPSWVNSGVNGHFDFDGVNDLIRIPSASGLEFGSGSSDRAFTLSAWVKMHEANKFRVLSKADGSGLEYTLTMDGNENLRMIIWDEDQSSRQDLISNISFGSSEGSWTQLCVTYSGSGGVENMKFFADGVEISTVTTSSGGYTAMGATGADMFIGSQQIGSASFADGEFSNVRVYNRELNSSELSTLYAAGYQAAASVLNSGLELIYEFAGPAGNWIEQVTLGAGIEAFSDTGVAGGEAYEYRVKAENPQGSSAYSNVASVETPGSGGSGPTVPAAPSGLSALAASSSQVDLSWTDASTNETSFVVERRTAGDEGTTVMDSSASGNDGSLEPSVGGPTWVDSGANGHFDFDGANDLIRVPSSSGIQFGNGISDNAFTLSTWVKMHEANKFRVMSKADGSGLEYTLTMDGNESLRMIIWDADQISRQDLISNTSFGSSEGNWTHLGVTYSGSGGVANMKFYADGVEISTVMTSSGSYSAMGATGAEMFIGSQQIGSASFGDGEFSNVRVYNRELGAAELSTLFAAGYQASSSVVGTGLELLYEFAGPAGNWAEQATLAEGVVVYSDTVVSAGEAYEYRVKAANTQGSSSFSNVAAVETPGSGGFGPTVPAAPGGLSALAISSAQVDLSWTDSSTNETSFIVERRIAGDEGVTVMDRSASGNHGSLEPSVGGPTWVNSGSSGHFDFDGANDLIRIPSSSGLEFGNGSSDSAFTLSAWVNMHEANKFRVLSKADGNGLEYTLTMDGNENLRMIIWDEDQSSRQDLISNTSFGSAEGSWTHLCVSYSGSGGVANMKFYAGGVEISTAMTSSGAYSAMGATGADMFIGSQQIGSPSFGDGEFSNVRVYNRELGAAELSTLFAAGYQASASVVTSGLVLMYEFSGPAGNWTEQATLGEGVVSYSDTAVTGGEAYEYRVKAGNAQGDSPYSNVASAETPGSGGSGPTAPSAPGSLNALEFSSTQVDLSWTDASTNETSFIVERRVAGDEGSIVMDASASRNDGSREPSVGGPIWVNSGLNGHYDFDGVNDLIRIPSASGLEFGNGNSDSAFTLSAWVRMHEANKFRVMSKADDSGLEYTLTMDGNENLRMIIWDEDQSSRQDLISSTSFGSAEGSWTHLSITYSGSGGVANMKMYANGVETATSSFSSGTYNAMGATGADMFIGSQQIGSASFGDGEFSNIRVYSRELTSGELSTLFAAGYQAAPTVVSNGMELLYEFAGPVGDWSELGSVGEGVESYADTTVATGEAYEYRVKAVNAVGSSSYSGVAFVQVSGGGVQSSSDAEVAEGVRIRSGLVMTAGSTGSGEASATSAPLNSSFMTIRWPSVGDTTYTVLVTEDLDLAFIPIESGIPATPPENVYSLPLGVAEKGLFISIVPETRP